MTTASRTPTLTRDAIDTCEHAGRTAGPAAGLAAALARAPAHGAPGGVVARPAAAVTGTGTRIPHPMAALEGVVFLREEPDGADLTQLTVLLGAARLGVTRRLAEAAAAHLAGRVSGGEPTLGKQLVQAALADLATETEVLRRRLLAPTHSRAGLAEVHDRLTALDWESVKLFGAGGYVLGSPAGAGHVSRLVANCWVAGPGTGC
ncbi:acyl-CoA dehydrogenase family protein [Streptomyces sp. NPDC056452]|uniref:acyl-CoA dehydrogenase family protein n=1 Tax=Streptomyces sp. NPDC056452 TaxID=3345821 RepID=UPI00367AC14F